MTTGECPNSSISGYQFISHYDCVNAGYAIAQKTFRNLKELEDFEQQYINEKKLLLSLNVKKLNQKEYKWHQ